jgi:hypothetical protein
VASLRSNGFISLLVKDLVYVDPILLSDVWGSRNCKKISYKTWYLSPSRSCPDFFEPLTSFQELSAMHFDIHLLLRLRLPAKYWRRWAETVKHAARHREDRFEVRMEIV